VLARYLLPVYPLVIILCVRVLWRCLSWWPIAVGVTAIAFVAGLFAAPPYRIAPEDNLTYTDFVRLHMRAASRLSALPNARVLTAWPATDELSSPYLGYVNQPIPVLPIKNFSQEEIMARGHSSVARRDARHTIAPSDPGWNYAFLFSTKYEPAAIELSDPWWDRVRTQFFDYHRDLPAPVAAELLGGEIIWQARSGSQWAAIMRLR
jgi:hypothetical protein